MKTQKLIESEKSSQEIVKSLTEATKIDLDFALSRARNFNSGLLSQKEAIEMIVKDLGFKPTRENLRTAEDHISASSPRPGLMIEDRDVYRELIGMLR